MKDETIARRLYLECINAQVDFNAAAKVLRERRLDWNVEEAKLLDDLQTRHRVMTKAREHLEAMGAAAPDLIADPGMAQVIADVENRRAAASDGRN